MEPTTPMEPRNDRGKKNSREVARPVSALPECAKCKVDTDHMLGIMGIVGTVLNLLVVVFVYMFTPI